MRGLHQWGKCVYKKQDPQPASALGEGKYQRQGSRSISWRLRSWAAQADAYFAELAEKLLADAGDLERLPENAGDVSEALAASIPTEIFDRQPPVVQGYLVRAMVSRQRAVPGIFPQGMWRRCGP